MNPIEELKGCSRHTPHNNEPHAQLSEHQKIHTLHLIKPTCDGPRVRDIRCLYGLCKNLDGSEGYDI